MVDPTSELNEDVSPDDAPACETCGALLVENPDHRVVTWVEDDTVESAHFCDEECRRNWDGSE